MAGSSGRAFLEYDIVSVSNGSKTWDFLLTTEETNLLSTNAAGITTAHEDVL